MQILRLEAKEGEKEKKRKQVGTRLTRLISADARRQTRSRLFSFLFLLCPHLDGWNVKAEQSEAKGICPHKGLF